MTKSHTEVGMLPASSLDFSITFLCSFHFQRGLFISPQLYSPTQTLHCGFKAIKVKGAGGAQVTQEEVNDRGTIRSGLPCFAPVYTCYPA